MKDQFVYGMRVLAAPAHPHISTGLPCTCPWGASKLASIAPKTASKIDWLKERNDKFLRTPEGQNAFDSLEYQVRGNPKLDDLAPWLWREIKKGRIQAGGRTFYANTNGQVRALPLDHIADWFGSNSPTRRGVDIMQLDVDGLDDRIKAWDDELQSKMDQEKQMHGTVVHDFSDPNDPDHPWNGWTVRRVDNAEQAKNEGDAMGHCVGGYGRNIETGECGIFSLRDPKNQPHATIETRPGEDQQYDKITTPGRNEVAHLLRPEGGLVHQIQGKQNMEPEENYKDMLRHWFYSLGGDIGANISKTKVPAPTDPDELAYWYQPEHADDYNHYQIGRHEAYDYGLDDGEGDDFEYEGNPDWDKVVDRLLHRNYDYNYHQRPIYDANAARQVGEIAHDTGQEDYMLQAAEAHRQALGAEFYQSVYDPNEYLGSPAMQWNRWHKGEKINALMGVSGHDNSTLPYDKDGIPLDQPGPAPAVQRDVWKQNFQPQLDEQYTGENGRPGGNWIRDPSVFSKTADYQGMTNWDTWNTKLMMDNERELMEAQEKMAEEGWTPEQIRDWALKHVVGPHNKQAIEDARSWNEIPEEERIDHHYEDFKEKHPEAMDLIHGLVGGPDVSDSEPILMDPELINWHEIHQHINNSYNENQKWAQEEAANAQRWTHFQTGKPDEVNHMLDAYIKHKAPEAQPLKEGDWRAKHPDADGFRQVIQPIHELDPDDFSGGVNGDFWKNNVIPNGGYPKYLKEVAWDRVNAIRSGQATPEQHQEMQQALAAQGHPPEAIQQITRQTRQWDPDQQKWQNLEQQPPQQPNPALDQPGDFFPPQEWTASVHHDVENHEHDRQQAQQNEIEQPERLHPRKHSAEPTGSRWSLYEPNPDGSVRPHTENPYERYSPNWGKWLQEREDHAWETNPGTLNTTYKDMYEWVPTEHLAPMLEWDRNVDGNPERVKRVHDSVRDVGFKEPVWLDYNPKTEMAHVSEGNHKLTMAIQHGVPSVPVMVYRSNRERPEISRHYKYVGPEQDHFGDPRPPQYMSPSHIGLPTVEPTPPWRVADDPQVGQDPPASASSIQSPDEGQHDASTR